MPNKDFLETYPLYRKLRTDWLIGRPFIEIPKPAVHMYCDKCRSDQTFNMVNQYYELNAGGYDARIAGNVARASYLCSACKESPRIFFIRFSIDVDRDKGKKKMYLCITKVGQDPPWSIEMDKNLERLLGKHAEYYKNGLICESQSYGIGAYAYFRRITEGVIDGLLDSLSDLIEPSGKEKYQKALEETKKTKVANEKIELVQDLLPSSLKTDGINPLKTLYTALSKGLHGKTDEECMKEAEKIKTALVYLVGQVLRTKKEKEAFVDSMKKLQGG